MPSNGCEPFVLPVLTDYDFFFAFPGNYDRLQVCDRIFYLLFPFLGVIHLRIVDLLPNYLVFPVA